WGGGTGELRCPLRSPSPVPSPFQPRPSASLVSPQGMPCPRPAVPSPVVALAGWCPLSPAGTQTTQLLVEPPWIPAVLWDRVTLTCQGSGTTGATSWYKGRWLWWQKGPDHFVVTESGTYRCAQTLDLAGASLGDASCPTEPLVLQVPARALLEGDTVTLRCRGWQDNPVTGVRFYKDEKDLQGSFRGSELSLPLLQLQHSGRYRCGGLMDSGKALSTPVTVTVHGDPHSSHGSPPGTPVSSRNLACVPPPLPCVPSLLSVSPHPSMG
uniref:Ig-like domain-containing protein n=1 Tax=Catharus ustulatus TaxID=91951 RepID=A0A8C3UVV1_CATUS